MGDFMTNAPDATSAEYSFKTGRQIGESSFPQTIGLVADVGLTSNSTVTLQHLIANEPEIALFVGGSCLITSAFSLSMPATPAVRG